MTLENRLVELIARRGPITFAEYMERALYDPDEGYYAGPDRTGWGGHYLTSPEIDPLFGELWANGIEQIWTAAGAPEHFRVVELGPGEGGLAAAVLEAVQGRPLGAALSYLLVERSPAARRRQHARLGDRVSWIDSTDELSDLGTACVIANEVFDNLPVHLFERSGERLLEVWVRVAQGRLTEALAPPRDPSLTADLQIPPGHRVEVCPAAGSLVTALAAGLTTGALIAIDYGLESQYLRARPEGTIVCYSDRGTDTRPLDRPGAKDITHHVDWTALRRALTAPGLEVVGPISQADVLRSLGAADADDRLHSEHRRALLDGRGADAVRALSRRQALGALLDTGGLGGLQVMAGLTGMETPSFLAPPR